MLKHVRVGLTFDATPILLVTELTSNVRVEWSGHVGVPWDIIGNWEVRVEGH